MATIKNFHDLNCWMSARHLTKEIYKLTQNGSLAKDFTLRDQMRRAAISIMSNIAEGFDRGGNKEFVHFLSIAKASASELYSQLYIALDVEYITQPQFDQFVDSITKTKKQINLLVA